MTSTESKKRKYISDSESESESEGDDESIAIKSIEQEVKWIAIPEASSYSISSKCELRNDKTKQLLKIGKSGTTRFTSNEGKTIGRSVPKLFASLFKKEILIKGRSRTFVDVDENEEWKIIPKCDKYSLSISGKIRRNGGPILGGIKMRANISFQILNNKKKSIKVKLSVLLIIIFGPQACGNWRTKSLNLPDQEWKFVPDNTRYIISSLGNVLSTRTGVIIGTDKYEAVVIYDDNNKPVTKRIGKMLFSLWSYEVCDAFWISKGKLNIEDQNSTVVDSFSTDITESMENMEWKVIPEAPEYCLSSTGLVKKIDLGRIFVNKSITNTVYLANDGRQIPRRITALLCRLFSFEHCGRWVERHNRVVVEKEEIWKDLLPELENYQASDKGNIRNKARRTILSPSKNEHGYLCVSLMSTTSKTAKHFYVHRLVAWAFRGPPPSSIYTVNHLNGIHDSNEESNLVWATPSEQMEHAFLTGLLGSTNSKRVRQSSLDGVEISVFPSISAAGKHTGIDMTTISKVCRGLKSRTDYIFEFVDPVIEDETFKENEIWRTTKKHPNYEVSSCGRVRRIGSKKVRKFRSDGKYQMVNIDKVGSSVHRLVAEAFIHNSRPGVATIVDHINERHDCNEIWNLRWVTQQENVVYALGKAVDKIDPSTGEVLETFRTTKAAHESTGATNPSAFYAALKSICCTKYRGFFWRYKELTQEERTKTLPEDFFLSS